jgi:hypothetical protein
MHQNIFGGGASKSSTALHGVSTRGDANEPGFHGLPSRCWATPCKAPSTSICVRSLRSFGKEPRMAAGRSASPATDEIHARGPHCPIPTPCVEQRDHGWWPLSDRCDLLFIIGNQQRHAR